MLMVLDEDRRVTFAAYKHVAKIEDEWTLEAESYKHLLVRRHVRKHFGHQFVKDANHERLLVIEPTLQW